MKTYNFYYKERGDKAYKTIKKVTGHGYSAEQNKMVVYTDEMIMEICNWDQCAVLLKEDFLNFQKANVKKEAGRD